jgi:hypothetical protein
MSDVSFEFKTLDGDDLRQVPGRIVYASKGLDQTGEVELIVSTCEALVWNTGEPAPQWQPIPECALPDGLVQRLSESVLDAVTDQQRQHPQIGNDSGA